MQVSGTLRGRGADPAQQDAQRPSSRGNSQKKMSRTISENNLHLWEILMGDSSCILVS